MMVLTYCCVIVEFCELCICSWSSDVNVECDL